MKLEYQLLLSTLLINKTEEEQEKVTILLGSKVDWCEVSGQLINHRIGGYFYKGLTKKQREKLPKELKRMLELIVQIQENIMRKRLDEFTLISKALEEKNIRYAVLKGLVFVTDFYELGARRSNDIDIMVLEEDLKKLDPVLRSLGYIQSNLPNGELVEASKREKLIQIMNYHDLVPYMKKTRDNELIELDINFKFDSNENLIDNEIYEYGTQIYRKNGYSVRGLPFYTHLLFLCIHFFREGTNSIWTSGKRDVVLYKIADIINYIRAHKNELRVDEFCKLIEKLKLGKKCYYTFHIINQFYQDETFEQIMYNIQPKDLSYINEIYIEGENKVVQRNNPFFEDAFDWVNGGYR